ncbi:predicted protein [Postia placenta Mad-698-R]|nr:predicted protein [Postia placenta Mad-698-R]
MAFCSMHTSLSSSHPTWLHVKAMFTPSTLRTLLTSTFQMDLRLSSSLASSSCALIGHLNRSTRTIRATRRSKGHNTRLVLKATSHPNPPCGILALSPPAPASLDQSLVQVKREKISLQTLCQSQSLRKVRVKKESWSLSLRILLGPPRRQHSPPCQQSLTFLSQLCIYWLVNTLLTTIELKVQVALSLLDSDARAWATSYFAQLMLVQTGTQGATTPFRNEVAFATAFRAHFGNLDDKVAAQVELAKLCADKSTHKKCTTTEFSALFKGLADCSRYGDLELHNKYLSSIPSHVYRKIELETFATWQEADKRATEVEQILDISRARQPELNNFFSA